MEGAREPDGADRAASPPRRPRLRGVLLAAAVLPLALVAVEGAARLRQEVRKGESARLARLRHDPASGLAVPVPGAYGDGTRVNAHGFRGPQLAVPKPPGTVRLAFLGGSTTFCGRIFPDAATWPHRVRDALAERHPDVRFDYVNAAVLGYGTAQSRVNLERRVAPLAPDVVVVYHATNDLVQDAHRLAVARGLAEEGGGPGWLQRRSVAWDLLRKNLRWRSHVEARERAGGLAVDPDALAAPFAARLEALVAACRAVVPEVVLVTFAHRPRRGMRPAALREASRSALYYAPWLDEAAILAGYEAYNRAIRAVARRTGATLVEGELAIPADGAHFFDSVHLTHAGNRLQAERVAAGLLASPTFARLVEAERAELRAAAAASPPR